ETSSIRFELPANAHQGPRDWYLIHLSFRIEFHADTGSGSAYVSAATGAASDPRTSAQIRFDVRKSRSRTSVSSDSLGLVNGHVVKTSTSLVHLVKFDNYIPYAGIKPGVNVLTFQIEQYQNVRVKAVTFFDDSGITY